MVLSIGDQGCAERTLKRSIFKRAKSVNFIGSIHDLVNKGEENQDAVPELQAHV